MSSAEQVMDTKPKIAVTDAGIGINWNAKLRRDDLPGLVVAVSGSASGPSRTPRWTVRVRIAIPENRNRQAPPNTGWNSYDQHWERRVAHVEDTLSVHSTRADAMSAAHTALEAMDVEATLDRLIEALWTNKYRNDSVNYMASLQRMDDEREARIEMIRRLRKEQPEFAALFPEPPAREDY
jgi:hypothetical protein